MKGMLEYIKKWTVRPARNQKHCETLLHRTRVNLRRDSSRVDVVDLQFSLGAKCSTRAMEKGHHHSIVVQRKRESY